MNQGLHQLLSDLDVDGLGANASLTLMVSIWLESSRASLVVTEAAMTALETPQALPRAVLEGTKTLWTRKNTLVSHRAPEVVANMAY